MKRIIIRVQWSKADNGWRINGKWSPMSLRTKVEAIRKAVEFAWFFVARNKTAQVFSHRKDGVIQWERTYPRSSDPRRSKG
jgi:hypothetical protein